MIGARAIIGSRRAARAFFASILTIISCTSVDAKSVTIDDSGTESFEPSVRMRWQNATSRRSAANDVMIGTTTVRVRINVTRWLKHTARIYLSLPAQESGPIRLSWSSQGQFQPG
jgi:hypothetical protein